MTLRLAVPGLCPIELHMVYTAGGFWECRGTWTVIADERHGVSIREEPTLEDALLKALELANSYQPPAGEDEYDEQEIPF